MSAARQSTARGSEPAHGAIPGDLHRGLEDLNVPAYAVDRFGVIRWINSAAKRLVGDIRGRQQSSVVVPEQGGLDEPTPLPGWRLPQQTAGPAAPAG